MVTPLLAEDFHSFAKKLRTIEVTTSYEYPDVLPNSESAQNSPSGVITSEGESQREQRRFVLRVLRDFGVGKIDSEAVIANEARYLHAEFKNTEGQPLDVNNLINEATANMIGSVLYGESSSPISKTMRERFIAGEHHCSFH